jgi:hypothetical protein
MRRVMTLVACVAACSVFAFAEDFQGRLVDASCTDAQQLEKCQPSGNTTAFAVEVGGKIYKLDDAGNGKVTQALKSRADRAANPDQAAKSTAPINVKVTGTKEGDIIKADSVDVQ